MWQAAKRKAGKGEFGIVQPATQAMSLKVVNVPADRLEKWLFPFLFCLFVCLFFYPDYGVRQLSYLI